MARPKSSEKRTAILEAATDVFAKRGVWQTPTSAISKKAGVAEGTLFTYFATKEQLVNELYLSLKSELADSLMTEYPKGADVRTQFKHLWDRFVEWGVRHPKKQKVMQELAVSEQLTSRTRAQAEEGYAVLGQLAGESIRNKVIRDYPVEFIGAIALAFLETTVRMILADRDSSVEYREIGFEIFWQGIVNE